MMESLVVSLETAKKLEAANFPQNTFYAYDTLEGGGHAVRPRNSISAFYRNTCLAAPSAQEIADQLPRHLQLIKAGDNYTASTDDAVATYFGDGPTMAEALAALYLKLQEAQR